MIRMLTLSLVILRLLLPCCVKAQQPGARYHSLEELLESLAGELEEQEEELTAWLEELQLLHENRVNINKAGREELLKIPFINELMAAEILEFREKYGPFFTVYELASIPSINREIAEKLSFFIVAGETGSPGEPDSLFKRKGYHDLMVRGGRTFPTAAGYRRDGDNPPAYQGSPEKIYTRYKYELPGKLQMGFTGDKDPGEPFMRKPARTGFDFCSYHAAIRINDRIPVLVVGDYTARTGQGLVLWQGFALGRTSDVMGASRNQSTITPYTSSDENRFFRGAAATFKMWNGSLNLLVSSRKTDANLAMEEDSTMHFTTLQTSGYHRTCSEISDRKSVRHSVAALFYTVTSSRLKAGFTALAETFGLPMNQGEQLYQKFLFRGKENLNAGIDYRWVTTNVQFYGEAAVSRSGGMAFFQGMEARLHDQMQLSLSCRHFQRNYHATWANAFAVNDKANNETGLFAGLRIFPAAKVTLSACADWYTRPWLVYGTASPSSGSEWMARADLKISRRLSGTIRVRSRVKPAKDHDGNLYVTETGTRDNLRVQASYLLNDRISLQTRAEMSQIRSRDRENGIMISQNLTWTPAKGPLSANLRFSWFRTDSYDTRIYTFENDVLYAFSSLSFYGEGIRSYINIRGNLTRNTCVWFKIANSCYFDRDKISSGHQEIGNNSKTEVKIEFRYRF